LPKSVQVIFSSLPFALARAVVKATAPIAVVCCLNVATTPQAQQSPVTRPVQTRPVPAPHVIPRPLLFKIEPIGKVTTHRRVSLDLTITPADWNTDQRDVLVTIKVIGKLKFTGEVEWRAIFPDSTSVKRQLRVSIPPNDTSGLEFSYKSSSMVAPVLAGAAYFVSEGDSVIFFRGDPRGFDVPHKEPRPEDLPPTGRRYKGEFPHSDSLYPIPDDSAQLQ
jgi:hypothetical protein